MLVKVAGHDMAVFLPCVVFAPTVISLEELGSLLVAVSLAILTVSKRRFVKQLLDGLEAPVSFSQKVALFFGTEKMTDLPNPKTGSSAGGIAGGEN
jgi:hypothetical protein